MDVIGGGARQERSVFMDHRVEPGDNGGWMRMTGGSVAYENVLSIDYYYSSVA